MCEIAVFCTHKESRDTAQRLMQYQPGDVVVVMPDGFRWGHKEVSSPLWRILQLPGVPVPALSNMLESRPHWKDARRAGAVRRQHFDATDPWLRGVLASGFVVQLTEADAARLLTLKRQRVEEAVMVVG